MQSNVDEQNTADEQSNVETQSTADAQSNVDVQSKADEQSVAEVQNKADDVPDDTALKEMGIPEEFLAGFDMAAEGAQADDVSEAALAAAHELFGE